MLRVDVPEREMFDNERQEFLTLGGGSFQIEHSLISLSKWESKWQKPFLYRDDKTDEEIRDYVRCMTVTPNVNPDIYKHLTNDNFSKIEEYINSSMTATWFNEKENGPKSREVITAEIIYYWMIAQNIPMECQKWHLNRLLTLIRVCSIKNQPSKRKRSKASLMSMNSALNQARRQQFNTKG